MALYRDLSPVLLVNGQSVGTGTTYTIGSSVITRPFKAFHLIFSSISHNSGANQTFRIEFSADNGGAWSAVQTISASVAAGATLSGYGFVFNADAAGTVSRPYNFFLGSNAAGTNMSQYAGDLSQAGPINALRLSPSANNFDGGTVSLIGWPV